MKEACESRESSCNERLREPKIAPLLQIIEALSKEPQQEIQLGEMV
jgi:hypothetical protein